MQNAVVSPANISMEAFVDLDISTAIKVNAALELSGGIKQPIHQSMAFIFNDGKRIKHTIQTNVLLQDSKPRGND